MIGPVVLGVLGTVSSLNQKRSIVLSNSQKLLCLNRRLGFAAVLRIFNAVNDSSSFLSCDCINQETTEIKTTKVDTSYPGLVFG